MDGDIPNGGPAANVPAELRALPQWVGWRYVVREPGKKPTKVPVDPKAGGAASSTDSSTWGAFGQALAGAREGRWDGVGFVFTAGDPYCGVDFDDVIDPATGEIDADAAADIEALATYAELSPSKVGVHAIARGELPPGGRKRGDRECYDRGRYFTFTGVLASPHGIEDRQAELAAWHAKTFPPDQPRGKERAAPPGRPLDITDADLVEKIRGSRQGPKFARLWAGDTTGYSSGSEADLALCSILSWWTRGEAERVDRLFRSSGLFRPKWDAKRGETTYGARTVGKAVDGTDGGYDPSGGADSPHVVFGSASQHGPAGPLPPIERWTHDQILGEKFGEQPFLVEGLVADQSLTILGGVQKAGKSWMSIQLAQAVAGGDSFLGRATTFGPVAYLALEDGVRRLQDRLMKQHSPRGLPITWYTRFPKLDGADGMRAFCDIAAEKPRLIVVDTLAAAKTGRTDEQASGPMADMFNALREIAQQQGVAILVVHHHGKTVSGDPAHDLRGSSAIGAAADVLLGLYRVRRNKDGEQVAADEGMPDPDDEERPDFYLKVRGRDIEDSTTAITFGVNEDWLWKPAPHGTHNPSTIGRHKRNDKVFEALCKLGRATVAQLMDETELGEKAVGSRLAELMHIGRAKIAPTIKEGGVGRPAKVYIPIPAIRFGGGNGAAS